MAAILFICLVDKKNNAFFLKSYCGVLLFALTINFLLKLAYAYTYFLPLFHELLFDTGLANFCWLQKIL